MSQQIINTGPGNNVAESEVKMFKCGTTVAKGNPVGFSDATAVAALGDGYVDGVTVEPSDVDAANPTLGAGAFGVAKEAGSAGDWIKVVVSGLCDYVVTDGSVEEGDVLIPTATAGAAGGTAGETGDLLGFGIALASDSGSVLTKAMIFKKF